MILKLDKTRTKISYSTCWYHKKYPFRAYAGCTCSSTISTVICPANNAIQNELQPSEASQTELPMMSTAGQIIKNHPQSS